MCKLSDVVCLREIIYLSVYVYDSIKEGGAGLVDLANRSFGSGSNRVRFSSGHFGST